MILMEESNLPKKQKVTDIDDYISTASPNAQPLLIKLREIIRHTFPDAEEKISYMQPFYIFDHKKISIAAYQSHVSLAISADLTDDVIEHAKQLGYVTGQKRLNIDFNQPVPVTLVNDILKIVS
jgi:uncharacterized protein YdhG (YjbR/CyaY superfamily)